MTQELLKLRVSETNLAILNLITEICLCFWVKTILCVKPFTLYENVSPLGLQVHFEAYQARFHLKDFAQALVLKQRHKVIRKWSSDPYLK